MYMMDWEASRDCFVAKGTAFGMPTCSLVDHSQYFLASMDDEKV